jgi:DNA polymerase-3 subunit epsilon
LFSDGINENLGGKKRGAQLSFGYGIGGCIDVETTGLSPVTDEIVEFSLVLFSYDCETAEVIEVMNEYTGLREPKCPISPGAFRVHGLTREQLRGNKLHTKAILDLLQQCDFLISHNARFDHGFVTSLIPETATKPWYCSMNGISWWRKGFNSKGLQNLLSGHGLDIIQQHRALDDARAIVTLLKKGNAKKNTYLKELLGSSPIGGPLVGQ